MNEIITQSKVEFNYSEGEDEGQEDEIQDIELLSLLND